MTRKLPLLLYRIAIAPFLVLGTLFFFALLALFYLFAYPFLMAGALRDEYRLRRHLRARGRLIPMKLLSEKLDAGEGALIAETAEKGPHHVWWTHEDLFALGKPPTTQEDVIGIFSGKRPNDFNSRILAEFVDLENGKALLTLIPPQQVRSGRLAQKFPKVKLAIAVSRGRQAIP